MTTKQDYINSIVQSLARIKLSEASEETLRNLDHTVWRISEDLDSSPRRYFVEDVDWAHFILQAETREEALDCFAEAERFRVGREQLRKIF